MKITILASGSKGNSTLIETKTKNILIDAGLPLSNLEKRLQKPMPYIDILIITHTHIDHIKGLKSVLKKHKPVIYTGENNIYEILPTYDGIKNDKKITNEDLEIELFDISHDVPCLGVSIKENDKELIYITDTGYIKDKIITKYKNKDIYILESNYDPEMLKNGRYPFNIKQRIRSDYGHLSNEDACRYLKTFVGAKTKYLCMAHLSEENNNPKLVEENVIKTLKNIDKKEVNTIICSQTEAIEITL